MTNDITRHSLSARLAACALLTVLFSAAAFAQSATSQTPAPKANLIIEQKAVRFDLRGSARSWQLEERVDEAVTRGRPDGEERSSAVGKGEPL